ncbi:MAG: hypothetical protein ACJ72E_01355 [Marmoricola sp.]
MIQFHDGPDLGDPTGWFEDGNYRFRFFVVPAHLSIKAESSAQTDPNVIGELINAGVNWTYARRRLRTDPRWKVVLHRSGRDAFFAHPPVVLAELFSSEEDGMTRVRQLITGWVRRQSYVDVEPMSYRALRKAIATMQGTGAIAIQRSEVLEDPSEPLRKVPWYASNDPKNLRNITSIVFAFLVPTQTLRFGWEICLPATIVGVLVGYTFFSWAFKVPLRD